MVNFAHCFYARWKPQQCVLNITLASNQKLYIMHDMQQLTSNLHGMQPLCKIVAVAPSNMDHACDG